MKQIFTTLILLGSALLAFGQTEVGEEPNNYHRITLVMSQTHIPEGVNKDGKKDWLILGSWGLDYDYWFRSKWAIGLHSDFIIENFEVETSPEGELEANLKRSYPLASALMGSFKPVKHLTVMVGAGGEFAKEETLFLIRTELEYGWELPHEWELGFNLMNDFKVDAYNSWTLGLGISKIFGSKSENGNY